ncbi:MAG: hypothetical protein ACJ746_31090 [Bryobacteraceae bacterium]
MRSVRISTLILLFAALGWAQYPIDRQNDAQLVERAMDDGSPGQQLSCHVQPFTPVLNFAFRFEVRFIVDCPLAQFEGRASQIASYVRVKPRGSAPVILGERLQLPAILPKRTQDFHWNRFHEQAEWSGVFTVGEGEYPVDLLVIDERNRFFRKTWNAKAELHGKERIVKVAISPNTAASASIQFWSDNPEVHDKGPRIDVLLDAAPLFPRELSLRAWDRAFLLNSLSSLLRTLHPDAVRVTAFNLDQQRQIFTDDNFTRHSFRKLFRSLQDLELGTVSYRNLRRTGWSELLTNLVSAEMKREDPPEAIIFLGPSARILDKLPREMLRSCESTGRPIFYLKFSATPGNEFPDAIHHLTNTCHGTVFTLHNAGDFAEAMAKVQRKIHPELAQRETGMAH